MGFKTYSDTLRIATDPAGVGISQLDGQKTAAHIQITDRNVARDFGTFILYCTGNPSLWTNEDYVVPGISRGTDGRLLFSVEDGVPYFTVDNGTTVKLPEDDAIDLGQRLIVWAGVK